jgi:transcriptional antiterminator RfaH
MVKEWFILQFKPNSHSLAKKNLNRQGFKTFLPLINSTSRQKSRFANITKPLFPGYMFVAFNKDISWSKINSTYGVSKLITFNSTLISVPSSFICDLADRCDGTGKLLPAEQLKRGDNVKILDGPFTNFIAIIETLESNQRISILMDLMGRQVKIKTSIENIQLTSLNSQG